MFLNQIDPKKVEWHALAKPNDIVIVKVTPLDWELSYDVQRFYGHGFFFIEICNYECRLIYFDGDIFEYVEDAEKAGITIDMLEQYIIETGNLSLSGWHPISSWILHKLLQYYMNNKHNKKSNTTQSHPQSI